MDGNPQAPEAPHEPKDDPGLLVAVLSFVALLGTMAYAWSCDLPNGNHWTVGSFLLFMGREAILVVFVLGTLLLCAVVGLWCLIVRAFRQ